MYTRILQLKGPRNLRSGGTLKQLDKEDLFEVEDNQWLFLHHATQLKSGLTYNLGRKNHTPDIWVELCMELNARRW